MVEKRESSDAEKASIKIAEGETTDLVEMFLWRRGIDVDVKKAGENVSIVTASNATRDVLRKALETIADLKIIDE